jgi:hypothetical protein
MLTAACVVGFIALVLFIYWLVTPTRSKPPRSQYTLPPLKPSFDQMKGRTVRQRVEAGDYGERLKRRWEDIKEADEVSPPLKHEVVAAMDKLPSIVELAGPEKAQEMLDRALSAATQRSVVHDLLGEPSPTYDAFRGYDANGSPVDDSLSHSDRIEHNHGGNSLEDPPHDSFTNHDHSNDHGNGGSHE